MTQLPWADHSAIQDLMLRYTSGLDDRDFPRYRACFTEDAEIHGFTPEVIRGANALMEFVRPAMAAFGPTQHMLAPAWITGAENAAHLRSDVQALHYFNEPAGRTLTVWGTYETDLIKIDGAWRIQTHRMTVKGTRMQEPEPG